MEILAMTMADYGDADALWRATAGVGLRSLDDGPEGIGRYLARNPGTSFVARDGGELKGTILCGHDGRRGYIYHLVVSEDARGRGVGRALVESALAALRSEGINKAALVAFSKNERGNGFWERLGFSARGDLVYRDMSLNERNV